MKKIIRDFVLLFVLCFLYMTFSKIMNVSAVEGLIISLGSATIFSLLISMIRNLNEEDLNLKNTYKECNKNDLDMDSIKENQKIKNIHKESTFIMYMTPNEVAQLNGILPEKFWGSNYKKVEDRILINGIIDLYFKDGDDYVLVDYKTDNVESMEELVERYEVQLKFYKKALEMNYNIEISELVIYSLKLNSQIIL